jgi:ABC-type sulfate/molybdate transport systems ATPase subunit
LIFFGGRGNRMEAPFERRQLRRVPRVLASSFAIVWEAAPGRFLASLAPQIVTAITTGAQLALARAFFRDAPLVILDEPTAALDARAEYDLFSRMRALFSRRSVLLISHRFSSVRSADRIYVLHEGRVVESGTHDELMHLGGRYAELFAMQASAYLPRREAGELGVGRT